jgi:HAMP domain-containing protein
MRTAKKKKSLISYFINLNPKTIQGRLTTGFLTVGFLAFLLTLFISLEWKSVLNEGIYSERVLSTLRTQSLALKAVSDKTFMFSVKGERLQQAESEKLEEEFEASLQALRQVEANVKSAGLKKAVGELAAEAGVFWQAVKKESTQAGFSEASLRRQEAKVREIQVIIDKEQSRTENDIASIQADIFTKFLLYFSLAFAMSSVVGYFIIKNTLDRIRAIKHKLRELEKGDLPAQIANTDDELNTIINAINDVTTNLREIKNFALEVGQGRFDSNVSVFNNQGELGTSLAEMRHSLKQVAAEDKRRAWAAEGYARFAEILRAHNDNINLLCDVIIAELVKYMHVNQGAIFILENQDGEDVLALRGCYAYNKKRFIDKYVHKGQGLVGQTFLEGKINMITEIPKSYISITSGLGEATPRCIVLIPLKVNDVINGVIEIASFEKLSAFELEFLSKVAESIASAISMVKTNEQTKFLLEESRLFAEQVQGQEEELRQNTEELIATQEELTRKLKEAEQEILRLRSNPGSIIEHMI